MPRFNKPIRVREFEQITKYPILGFIVCGEKGWLMPPAYDSYPGDMTEYRLHCVRAAACGNGFRPPITLTAFWEWIKSCAPAAQVFKFKTELDLFHWLSLP